MLKNISSMLNNGKWFALGAALLVVAAALFSQTYNFYLIMMRYEFCQVMIHCWYLYVLCAVVGVVYGAIIGRASGGSAKKGCIVGVWSIPVGLLICHIGVVVYDVLNYRFS